MYDKAKDSNKPPNPTNDSNTNYIPLKHEMLCLCQCFGHLLLDSVIHILRIRILIDTLSSHEY